ncbi:MAG: OmpA family protein [Bacteroidota bacterium]
MEFLMMFRRLTVFVFLFLVGMVSLNAQDLITKKNAPKKAADAYTEARKLAYEGDLEKAIKSVEKALKISPNFFEANYLMADLMTAQGDRNRATNYFEKAIGLGADYQPRVWYSYGVWLYKENDYEAAVPALKTFIEYDKIKASRKDRAQDLIANMEFRLMAVQNPVDFKPVNMGQRINSKHDDLWPSISIDDNTFVFTRNVNRNEDFFVAERIGDNWTEARSIGPPINTSMNEGAQSLSADGRFFAYTVCNREGVLGRCDIYIAEKIGDRWTEPYNIGEPVNSKGYESQPSLSADGRTLIFCREMAQDDGARELMISTIQPDGTWSVPLRLPETINSTGDEEAPFLHPDGQTLYFVSNGHPGMGDSDLFMSRKTQDGWSPAENLGFPINTPGKEFSIMVDFQGKQAYFTSNQDGGFGGLDLYQFDLPETLRPQAMNFAQTRVVDATTGEPVAAFARITDLETAGLLTKQSTDQKGELLVCLPLGRELSMHVKAEGYLFHSEHFAISEESSQASPYVLDILLQPIPEKVPESNEPIVLENIFFKSGSAELEDRSQIELNQLVELLESNPTITILIGGHTDDVGEEVDNLKLSQNRAKAVNDYLVEAGISPYRLEFKGFGETQPIAENTSPEGRAKNRRTTFEILRKLGKE